MYRWPDVEDFTETANSSYKPGTRQNIVTRLLSIRQRTLTVHVPIVTSAFLTEEKDLGDFGRTVAVDFHQGAAGWGE